MITRKIFITSTLLAFALLLAACGPSDAELTPTVNPDAIRTEAVSTFASSLTETALANPTATITLTPTLTNTPIALAPTNLTTTSAVVTSCYKLVYVADVTIPDNTQMTPGQTFTKTWRVQNTGSCAWAPGFKFTLVGGDAMGGQTLSLPQAVAIGATTELSVAMTAPSNTGTAQGTWRMSDDKGAYFGDPLTVVIVVGGTGATSTPGTPATSAATSTTTPTITAIP